VREAAALLAPRPAIVVVVWEPGLAYTAATTPALEAWEVATDVSQALDADQAIHEAAHRLAAQGKALAESGGMPAAAVAIADDNVAETLVRIAHERAAGAIVVGAHIRHGLSRIGRGSTAKDLMERADCPVVVVPSTVE
jgi:nucleotide-binding universal stress UspA family protein